MEVYVELKNNGRTEKEQIKEGESWTPKVKRPSDRKGKKKNTANPT